MARATIHLSAIRSPAPGRGGPSGVVGLPSVILHGVASHADAIREVLDAFYQSSLPGDGYVLTDLEVHL